MQERAWHVFSGVLQPQCVERGRRRAALTLPSVHDWAALEGEQAHDQVPRLPRPPASREHHCSPSPRPWSTRAVRQRTPQGRSDLEAKPPRCTQICSLSRCSWTSAGDRVPESRRLFRPRRRAPASCVGLDQGQLTDRSGAGLGATATCAATASQAAQRGQRSALAPRQRVLGACPPDHAAPKQVCCPPSIHRHRGERGAGRADPNGRWCAVLFSNRL